MFLPMSRKDQMVDFKKWYRIHNFSPIEERPMQMLSFVNFCIKQGVLLIPLKTEEIARTETHTEQLGSGFSSIRILHPLENSM